MLNHITITDLVTRASVTVWAGEFMGAVLPWFPGAQSEILAEIMRVQEDLNRGTFISGSAVNSLGLDIVSAV